MPTITIPASEVREGDTVDLGGHLRPVRTAHPTVPHPTLGDQVIVYVDEPFSAIHFPAGQRLEVARPDPDAEAVEVMAKAITPWVSSRISEEVARIALAAYREHTQA